MLCQAQKTIPFNVVTQIQVEADFNNLPSLVRACESYVMDNIGSQMNGRDVYCEYSSEHTEDLINVVSTIWAPFCFKGVRSFRGHTKVFQSSTLEALNLDELRAAAVVAPFCKGTKTLDALEISADQLDPDLWKQFYSSIYFLYKLSPRMKIKMKPYKLVIYKEGGHFAEHRDSVRGENHVGTLVQIMNSEFTGGELVVRQNDKEVSISKPGEWIAIYGDTLHRIEPVTSVTRVELIFDLYQTGTHGEKEFLEEYGSAGRVAEAGYELAVNDDTRSKVFAALEKEFECFQDVVICLSHLYPLCQPDPARLKGGDALLYQLLAERESDYELSIVPVKIHQQMENFFNDLLEAVIVDLEGELSGTFAKEQRNILLIIPVHCLSNHVLFYNPYLEYVGKKTLVTGLQIHKRSGKDVPEETEACTTDEVAEAVPTDTTVYLEEIPEHSKAAVMGEYEGNAVSTAADYAPGKSQKQTQY